MSIAEREALRFQSLRTRAACARGTMLARALPDLPALFEWASSRHELDELVRCLAISGAAIPDEWLDPDRMPVAWKGAEHLDLRVAIADWYVTSLGSVGRSDATPSDRPSSDSRLDPRSGVKQLASLLSGAELTPATWEKLAARIRRTSQEGEPEHVARFLSAVRDALPADSTPLDRLEVLSGCATPEVELRVLGGASSDSRPDLLCLGALAAGRQGESARAALLKSIGTKAVPRDLAAALDRAVTELRAARAEKEERAFVVSAREAARGADPKLRALLRADLWPPPQKSDLVHVSELDRRLRTSGL
jgi:hypothetical protein